MPYQFEVNLVPFQAMAGGNRMGVVVVVPAFPKGKQGHPPAVGREVSSNETSRAPAVRGRVHQPGGVQSDHSAEENSPQQKTVGRRWRTT